VTFPPIAIVGRGCVLPGALSPGALWEQVLAGADLVTAAPRGRWGVNRASICSDAVPGVDAAWTDRGGYVAGFDAAFDPTGFALPAEQVLRLDPLVRWLLHVSREALREGGVAGGPRVAAVFGNLSFPSASLARYAERVWLDPVLPNAGAGPPDARNRFMSGLPVHLLAQALGLGPGFALDAACASSLYAIKLACDLLHDRRADLVLAGAVNAADDLFLHVGFTALQALSRSGRSRPFHREADGLLPAEGAGAVLLKRLEDAQAAGDRVFAVIRGVGLSNDGRGRGLLVPGEEGQERAMRAAYAAAGLQPGDISLLECHATGTAVGDAVEVRSAARVFAGVADLPAGSLKSNFGHAVTAAGVAGLLKLVGALSAGVRPPTLHANEPLAQIAGTPLRLLREAEPWACRGVRRAALSAFGFGGANAHLIVEEPGDRARAAGPRRGVLHADAAIAVVGIGAAVGAGRTAAEFAAALFADETAPLHGATTISLPVVGTRFPPNDLAAALPQQLWTLAAAREALGGVALPAPERAGVTIGVACDPVVARYGARWRLPTLAAAAGVVDDAWVRRAADLLSPALTGAGVLGTMPNLPANRLNVQFDLAGPGFTLSAEELSGVRALQVALRALRAGELDLALAGAADFSCDPVHEAAAAALGLAGPAGDGAVVVALKRLADAQRDGDRVYAVVDAVVDVEADVEAPEQAPAAPDAFGDAEIAARYGRAHAAFGLVRVVAAVVACAAGRRPGGAPWPGERRVELDVSALGGQRVRVGVRAAAQDPVDLPAPQELSEPTVVYHAHRPAPGLPALPVSPMVQLPAPSLAPAAGEPPCAVASSGEIPSSTMPPAPSLGPLLEGDEPSAARPAGAALATPPPAAPAPEAAFAQAAVAQLVSQVALAARVHRDFLESQAAAHREFLAFRERAAATLLTALNAGGAGQLRPAGDQLSLVRAVSGNMTGEGVARRGGLQRGSEARPAGQYQPSSSGMQSDGMPNEGMSTQGREAQCARGRVTESEEVRSDRTPQPARVQSSLLFDRNALRIHANGNLSALFGPDFADHDALARRVRMPEPPLLLADRVVGLEGQPRSLGTGVVRTETDVAPGAWYLHDNRMPAGIVIEAGQADLLLISWLGVDVLNRGERVYRLLGCELTYHGGLPVAGETLHYEIGVDGHAQQGDVRLFFFHSTCTSAGVPRLTVRGGQAGFFTDGELDASAGVLWDPLTVEPRAGAQLDPPPVPHAPARLTREQLAAFAAGRADECFGPGFELAATHTRTPHPPGGRLQLLEEVTEIAVGGGPWKRGYLRAVDRIDPGDWFFAGHFTNDPCMPGTLMFEGCLQAMAVYLAAAGFTLERDGWRFEPVPEEPFAMRCRGQVTPASRELVYEIFVEELIGGPEPTLYADLLCTVDGLKAFHCRRMGLRLVPGWPLDSRPELLDGSVEDQRAASGGGVRFDGRSLLACAWGRPTAAFGQAFAAFDGVRRLARLPGPPYQFMSRVVSLEGEMGAMREGSAVEVEYDIPADAWYFAANGARTMPFAVLLEAALQPCGWLATWAGSPLTSERDLSFRNLDGDGRLLAEVLPGDGTLRTRAVLTRISRSAGMLIESFDVVCSSGGRRVYELKTVFGYFPAEALARQVGLPAAAAEREALAAASAQTIDLRGGGAGVRGAQPQLATAPLLMIDRVTGIWPTAGAAGLGRYRAETDVDAAAWFFKAHFFQDPVQPGSLGLEAMLQLLQYALLQRGLADPAAGRVRFEPLALGVQHSWKYRGQVLPRNRTVTTTLELTRLESDGGRPLAVADAALWVDGTKIYEARGLAMRIVRDAPPADDEEVLDPAVDTWLQDHRPTWTVPALPLMSMVDRLARAAVAHAPGMRVEAVADARALRWVPVAGPLRLKAQVAPAGENAFDVTLLAWRDAANESLSRFEPVATGRVLLGPMEVRSDRTPQPAREPGGLPAIAAPDPYETGTLFHGPAFQLLRSLALAPGASTALLDAGAGGEPRGLLHEALLDALTHGIPHDRLSDWSPDIPADRVAYPHRIVSLRLFGPLPRTGAVRCETRFAGFDGDPRYPRFQIEALAGDRVVAALDLVEVLFPKGALGSAPPGERRAFLRDRRFVPGLRLSRELDGATTLSEEEVRASDWLPGTLAQAYAATGELLLQIAVKEHVASRAAVHPSSVTVAESAASPGAAAPASAAVQVLARCAAEPLNVRALLVGRAGGALTVRDAGPATLDPAPVRAWWDGYFRIGRWPVEDIYFGLAQRFVRRVRLEDPAGFAALRGRGVLYLANHQVGIESILFSLIASGLSGILTVTLAKIEHRTTWLGNLIRHAFAWPGAHDPGVITYFDRSNREELPRIIGVLAREISSGGKSVMIHVEGTRSLSCRAPVVKMSGAFLDMAIATGAPVVPVRFSGGLPVEPLTAKLEYPLGMGGQEIRVGAAIAPAQLAALPYKERKELVIAAINGLGPAASEELPLAPDPGFAAAAAAWEAQTGASPEHAALFETLRRLGAPGAAISLLFAGAREGQLAVRDDPEGRWLAELARRLYGPRGPRVVVQGRIG
jgi:3-oxoacyl-(acyl-carrier-protein) synthase/3-hydroxymyristoyl/3-hydroxydecanoyl-(acyl carrier protein) dehydratase/1-acyl-sn-glycerol-3-phosphate acyltransferase